MLTVLDATEVPASFTDAFVQFKFADTVLFVVVGAVVLTRL